MRIARNRISMGIIAIVLAAMIAAWRWQAGPSVDAYRVARSPFTHTLVASGRIESPRRVEIGSSLTAAVSAIPVAEGETVGAGQLLIALDDAEARAAVEQAASTLVQAQERIRQLNETALPVAEESVRVSEANYANAQRQWERSRDLHARGFIGEAALDEAARSRDVAHSQRRSSELQRASQSRGGSDYRLAEAALAQARAGLRAAQARLDLFTIEAPQAGVLISRSVEKGNVVQPGKVLMTLAPTGATQAVVLLDERNIHAVAIGQSALVSADAYPQRRFAARVSYINPAVDASRGSVEVKLVIPEPPSYLLQDMTVSVDIEVARSAAALALPTDAIRDDASSAPWVLVVRAGRAARQPVKLGTKGDARVEVVEGVAEGELVVPASARAIQEGMRLRAAAREAAQPGRS